MTGADILAIFREEAAERLDRLVEDLLRAEREPASPETVHALFRHAHSIKGAAGMVGLEDVATLAHVMEEALGDARQEGALAPSMIDPLLQATDALRKAAAGESEIVPDAVAALEAARQGPAEVAVAAAAPAAPAEPAEPAEPAAPGAGDMASRTIRVDAEHVDRLLDAAGEAALHHRRLGHELARHGLEEVDGVDGLLDEGDLLLEDMQDAALRLRTAPLSSVTSPFARAVRDLAVQEGKEVEFVVTGEDTRMDRALLEGTRDALTHLLRNAVDHAIEPPEERERAGKPRCGRVELRASSRGDLVSIEVVDDGRGVAPELLRRAESEGSLALVLSEAGLSTAAAVTAVSGRGVGMDAVRRHVEAVGGALEIDSRTGAGTTVRLVMPVTLALMHVLLAERAGQVFGVPVTGVTEALTIEEQLSLRGRRSVRVGDDAVPAADLITLLGSTGGGLPQRPTAIVVRAGGTRAAVLCDRIDTEEDVVVKPLGPLLAGVPGYLGAAILGDGRLALIVDPSHLVRTAQSVQGSRQDSPALPRPPREETSAKILVVDDQFTVRELQRSILEAAGYTVETARDGREALRMLSTDGETSLVVTDVEMPEMDGIELLTAIRARPESASLPVVIVTSRDDPDSERQGAEAGADAYIVKQRFDQQALLETVARLVGR